METKHVVIIGVVVALFLAFFGYRYFKGNSENRAHRQDTYGRMIEMAQKSPRHGLAEMGMFLNRYYADHKAYPPALDALYPDYVSSKAFIQEIAWKYAPKTTDFFLSKTVTVDGREMIASIDSRLKLKIETGVMLAAGDETSGGVSWGVVPKAPPRRPGMAEIRDTGDRPDLLSRSSIGEPQVVSVDEFETAAADRMMTIAPLAPETISVVESGVASIAASDMEARYLVWKDDRGTLGFGNIDYPGANSLSIARRGKWYSVQRHPPDLPASAPQAGPSDTQKKSLDRIAADLRGWSLIWKDPEGGIGFGNVDFPGADRLSISAGNRWVTLEKRRAGKTGPAEPPVESPAKKAPEEVAEGMASQHLVWKDNTGSVGFGNVEYPQNKAVAVHSGRGWNVLKETPVPAKDRGGTVVLEEKQAGDIVSRIGGSYLVWKDKNGTVGFGDVEYPDLGGVSQVRDSGRWKAVATNGS